MSGPNSPGISTSVRSFRRGAGPTGLPGESSLRPHGWRWQPGTTADRSHPVRPPRLTIARQHRFVDPADGVVMGADLAPVFEFADDFDGQIAELQHPVDRVAGAGAGAHVHFSSSNADPAWNGQTRRIGGAEVLGGRLCCERCRWHEERETEQKQIYGAHEHDPHVSNRCDCFKHVTARLRRAGHPG